MDGSIAHSPLTETAVQADTGPSVVVHKPDSEIACLNGAIFDHLKKVVE